MQGRVMRALAADIEKRTLDVDAEHSRHLRTSQHGADGRCHDVGPCR